MRVGAARISRIGLGHFTSTDGTTMLWLGGEDSYRQLQARLAFVEGSELVPDEPRALDVDENEPWRAKLERSQIEVARTASDRLHLRGTFKGNKIDTDLAPTQAALVAAPAGEHWSVAIESADTNGVTASVTLDGSVVAKGRVAWASATFTAYFASGVGQAGKCPINLLLRVAGERLELAPRISQYASACSGVPSP